MRPVFFSVAVFILGGISCLGAQSHTTEAGANAGTGRAAARETPWLPPTDRTLPVNAVLGWFHAISQIPRPSGGEESIRRFLLRQVQNANEARWSGRLQTCTDPKGNVLVTIPGTGRFATSSLPPIALQAHMDMVWTARGAAPGADLHSYFQNGVRIAESNGWLHSSGHATTLGADDGIGIAMALRYLDPSLEHPPLELAFTVQEETDTEGAHAFSCPLHARAFLNLDNEEGRQFAYGSQGVRSIAATGHLPTRPVPAGYQYLRIRLANLKGGHSGVDIHLQRLNAIRACAAMWQALDRASDPAEKPLLVSMAGGNAHNAIPSSAEMILAVPAPRVSAAVALLRGTFARELARSPGEAGTDGTASPEEKLTIARPNSQEGPTIVGRALEPEAAARLMDGILLVPDGPLIRRDGYPERVEASSNLGLFSVKSGEGAAADAIVQAHCMLRNFDDHEMDGLSAESRRSLGEALGPQSRTRIQNSVPSWITDRGSWLVHLAQARFPGYEMALASGGLETSEFVAKLPPGTPILSMGPLITGAHSADESLNLASLEENIGTLDSLIQAIASSPRFH